MGGSSDPFCKVTFGPFKARTRILKTTLNPQWNETFIFVLEPDALALMGSVPVLSFQIWDHNNFAPNYFLGEVNFTHQFKYNDFVFAATFANSSACCRQQ